MRRVRCSAAARLAARFTAVVVLPTPPFWFAIAIIRATKFRCRYGAKSIHPGAPFPRGTLPIVFHVEISFYWVGMNLQRVPTSTESVSSPALIGVVSMATAPARAIIIGRGGGGE